MTLPTVRVAALYEHRALAERATRHLQARGISHHTISELSSELDLEIAQLEGINIVGEMAPAALSAIESLRYVHPVVDWQAVFRSLGLSARRAAMYCGCLRRGQWMVAVRTPQTSAPLNQLVLELLGGRHAVTFSPQFSSRTHRDRTRAARSLAG